MKPAPLRFVYGAAAEGDRPDLLSVDGVFGAGPNLSHWPGHRTPPAYRHELSTGSALLWARDPGRAAFVRGVKFVANNHYDTDGLCALFACLKPETALAHEATLLAAAKAGDYEEADDVDAVRRDALVAALPHHPDSPIAFAIRGLPAARAEEFAYRYLLERLPGALLDLAPYEPLWRDASARFERDRAALASGGLRVERFPAAGFAALFADDGVAPGPYGLATAGAPLPRLLLIVRAPEGPHYRFRQGTRTWFDAPGPRARRLAPAELAAALSALEPPRADGAAWRASDGAAPACEVWFGREAETGAILDAPGITTPSRLPPDVVRDVVLRRAAACDAAATD